MSNEKTNTEVLLMPVHYTLFMYKVKDMNAIAYYSRSVGEKMHRSCVNSTCDHFFF